jgi:hypothetical protein
MSAKFELIERGTQDSAGGCTPAVTPSIRIRASAATTPLSR